MEMLKELLNKTPGVAGWKIVSEQIESSELYYVGKKLETNRASDTSFCEVTVYIDANGMRGSSVFTVYPWMDGQELEALINENVFAAGFAMNPFYELPAPEEVPAMQTENSGKLLRDLAEEAADAIFAADHVDGCYLSATEIFLYRKTVRIMNSRGIDVSETKLSGMAELIPTCRNGMEETEIIHEFRFADPDFAALTAETAEYLQIALDRSCAVKLSDIIDTSALSRIILQDSEAGRIFSSYFANDLSYERAYLKTARIAPGERVQDEHCSGTSLNLSMYPAWENAVRSAKFDEDGVVLKSAKLIDNGIAVKRFGSSRFGFYLGAKDVTGRLPITVVGPGTKSFKEMTKEPYIRCKVFSGIQIEGNSGYLGGEVRLGYYFDGEREIPVTGFSISGNLREACNTMIYSAETVTTENYHGPKYLEITGMQLA